MGKPILQIPKTHPTDVIMVDYSTLEHEIYRAIRSRYTQIREEAKSSTTLGGVSTVPKGEVIKLFNLLRFFSSHPALVDSGCLIPSHIAGARGPEPLEVTSTMVHIFCRLCRNVLFEPQIGEVGTLSP